MAGERKRSIELEKKLEEQEFIRYPFCNDFYSKAIQTDDDAIGKIKKEILTDLEVYRLSKEGRRIVDDFTMFHLQTLRANLPEAGVGYFNLIIRTPDFSRGEEMAEILCKSLFAEENDIFKITEKDLLKEEKSYTGKDGCLEDKAQGFRAILILECKKKVSIDADLPSSSMRESNIKEVESYQKTWERVLVHAKKHPEVAHILIVGEHNYSFFIQKHRKMAEVFFHHHIFLPKQEREDLWKQCVEMLKQSSFKISNEFLKELKEYYEKAYETTSLEGREFNEEVVNSLYTGYYAKKRKNLFLTRDCIPFYKVKWKTPEEILGRLNTMTGLRKVKKEFMNLYLDCESGKTIGKRYHMIFEGNPGTGKTTVAKLTADLFYSMHITKTNKLVQTKPSDFVSEWVGGTGLKASSLIQSAYEGVLFVDEAYGFENLKRKEQVFNILLQEMEEHTDDLVVIMAGYPEEMRTLLNENPGLESRFGKRMVFEDYSEEELLEIYLEKCKKEGFCVEKSAIGIVKDCIRYRMCKENFGNAREMETLFDEVKEKWVEEQFQKGKDFNRKMERTFMEIHFKKTLPDKEKIRLDNLVGLDSLKIRLHLFEQEAAYKKLLKEKRMASMLTAANHMLFLGNPGTGKTTVANILAEDLYSLGVIKKNHVVTVHKSDLQHSMVGKTAEILRDFVRRATGGVLFIDEAYELSYEATREATEVLLEELEKNKEDLLIIMAGYPDEMQEFLKRNPGLESRIGYTFYFEDYTTKELTKIFERKMKQAGFEVSKQALLRVTELMEFFSEMDNFGNGRFVDKIIQLTISKRAQRSFIDVFSDIEEDDIPTKMDVMDVLPDGRDLDMNLITEKDQKKRIAIHELGHALVILHLAPSHPPMEISIRGRARSAGRVQNRNYRGAELSEGRLKELLMVYLAGRNAEILMLGDSSAGCAEDYQRAKYLAEGMVRNYAMGTIGKTTSRDLLMEADQKSMEILKQYQEKLEVLLDYLLDKEVMSGEELLMYLNKKELVGKEEDISE